tara:strand:+ start:2166 stop:2525 length:360 start_codon:yes stop_codon:yes gene_type:complete
MQITESNKLIAEFMGGNFNNDGVELKNFENLLKCYMNNELKYHKSWDWLMPVVEKIQSLHETKTEFGTLIDISTTHVSIRCKDFKYSIDKISKNWKCFDINNLYKVIVEFIKWYNEQKQ